MRCAITTGSQRRQPNDPHRGGRAAATQGIQNGYVGDKPPQPSGTCRSCAADRSVSGGKRDGLGGGQARAGFAARAGNPPVGWITRIGGR